MHDRVTISNRDNVLLYLNNVENFLSNFIRFEETVGTTQVDHKKTLPMYEHLADRTI